MDDADSDVSKSTQKTRFFVLTFLAHGAIIAAYYVTDLMQGTKGLEAGIYGGLSAVLCISAAIYFMLAPQRFFFRQAPGKDPVHAPSAALRIVTWMLVLVTPIVWLLVAPTLPKLVAGYIFFLYFALSAHVHSILFPRNDPGAGSKR